jgi:group I intron endonuclease
MAAFCFGDAMNYYLYQYLHRDNGKQYIGVTMDLQRRTKSHASGHSVAPAFNNAMKKYGIGAFVFRILAIFDNKDEAARIEQAAIKSFGTLSPNGYNLNGGAPGTRYAGPPSEETRAKISAAATGRKPSKETCAKISASNKGKIRSAEQRKNISNAAIASPDHMSHIRELIVKNKGIPLSPECRQNMSIASRASLNTKKHLAEIHARPVTLETRQKMSVTRKGKKRPTFSEEWCRNISIAQKTNPKCQENLVKLHSGNKGRIPSLETRQKISIALKGRSPWNKGITKARAANQPS